MVLWQCEGYRRQQPAKITVLTTCMPNNGVVGPSSVQDTDHQVPHYWCQMPAATMQSLFSPALRAQARAASFPEQGRNTPAAMQALVVAEGSCGHTPQRLHPNVHGQGRASRGQIAQLVALALLSPSPSRQLACAHTQHQFVNEQVLPSFPPGRLGTTPRPPRIQPAAPM